MMVKNRAAAIGTRVRLNADGMRWIARRRAGPHRDGPAWTDREGVIAIVSVNRELARVQWAGCTSRIGSDYLPLKFLEEIC